jgi:hypothetical protein
MGYVTCATSVWCTAEQHAAEFAMGDYGHGAGKFASNRVASQRSDTVPVRRRLFNTTVWNDSCAAAHPHYAGSGQAHRHTYVCVDAHPARAATTPTALRRSPTAIPDPHNSRFPVRSCKHLRQVHVKSNLVHQIHYKEHRNVPVCS